MQAILRSSCALALLAALAVAGPHGGRPSGVPSATPLGSPLLGGLHPTSLPIVDNDLGALSSRLRARLEVAAAHVHSTGRGVTVAVLDGGFDLEHPALSAHLASVGFDAIDEDADAHDPGNGLDDDGDGLTDRAAGHGTFVAGMVLLVAPDATILPIRVRDDEGWGSDQALLRGLSFARARGVEIVNMSVSSAASRPQALLDLMAAMHAEGTTIVVSAGNERGAPPGALACSSAVLVAVALDENDCLAAFSNRVRDGGPCALGAPGRNLPGPLTHGRWGRWSGTSFSAGLVSGAAALVRAHAPALSAAALYGRLRASLDSTSLSSGCGCVNLRKAVVR